MGNNNQYCGKESADVLAEVQCERQISGLDKQTNYPQIAKILSKPSLNYMKPKQITYTQLPLEDIPLSQLPPKEENKTVQMGMKDSNKGQKYLDLEGILQMEQKKMVTGKIEGNWHTSVKIKKQNYLDEYVFIKQIGQGSYASIIKTKMKTGGSPRAAKIIKAIHITSDSVKSQKLFAEISIPLKLDHPNLVKLSEVFQWKSHYVLIMQLCEGGDLFHYIKQNKVSSEAKLANIMKQILLAVNYMHKLKVAHRDLKPQNILYDSKTDTFKVSDFGCATLFSDKVKLKGVFGAPYYIAPEMITGQYNQKCDIWSCGVILYILLSGSPPFNGKSQRQVLQKIQTKPLQFNSLIWRKRNKETKQLIKKMLHKNPNDRISAEEALKSKWFLTTQTTEQKEKMSEIEEEVVKNFKSFHFTNKLKALLYTFISSKLCSNKDRNNLLQVFKQMDADGDGVIGKEELMTIFNQKSTSRLTESQIQKVLGTIDTNNSGRIDFTEFLIAATNQQKMLDEQRLNQAFNYLDTARAGFITIEEVKSFLDGSNETSDEIKKIFKEFDINGDGQISKKEFIAFLLKKE